MERTRAIRGTKDAAYSPNPGNLSFPSVIAREACGPRRDLGAVAQSTLLTTTFDLPSVITNEIPVFSTPSARMRQSETRLVDVSSNRSPSPDESRILHPTTFIRLHFFSNSATSAANGGDMQASYRAILALLEHEAIACLRALCRSGRNVDCGRDYSARRQHWHNP